MQSPVRGGTRGKSSFKFFSPDVLAGIENLSHFFYLMYSTLQKGDNEHFYILIIEIKWKSIAS